MLIAFSGAQSSGKTTLLNMCKQLDEFKKYTFIDEVTRRIKNENNAPINDSEDDYEYTQTLIAADHIKNMTLKNAVLDRCALDGWVYTTYFHENGKVSSTLYDFMLDVYYRRAMYYYDFIFYTDPSIPLIDDGVRSCDTGFRDRIIELFDKEIHFLKEHRYFKNKIIKLKGSVDERIEIIKKTIRNAN